MLSDCIITSGVKQSALPRFNRSKWQSSLKKMSFLCQVNQPLGTEAALKNVKTEKREG